MPPSFSIYKQSIDEYIRTYLASIGNDLNGVNPWTKDSIDRLSTMVTQGKTIRGGLVLWAHDAFGGTSKEDALNIACAIELTHMGLLIHDDIMDLDETRRGNPSLYAQYASAFESIPPASRLRFGSAMATCVGDMAFFMANRCLSSIDHPNARVIATICQREFSAVTLAQMQDVYFGFSPDMPTKEDVLQLYKYKTGRYTVSLPLVVGSLLGKTQENSLQSLWTIGENLGMVFQIHDDELNLFGDPNITGKPNGSDIREQKKTYAYVLLYSLLSPEEKNKMSIETNDDARVSYVSSLMGSYSIADRLHDTIRELTGSASGLYRSLGLTDSSIADLDSIATYFSTRTS